MLQGMAQLHVGDRTIVDKRVRVDQHGLVDKESVRRDGDGRYRRRYSRRRFVWERLTGISVVRPSFIFRM
jgi:hypothetical protein